MQTICISSRRVRLGSTEEKRGSIEKSFNVLERDELDKECALMFYTGALSFNFARNPYFRSFCLKLANGHVAGYSPPTYSRLRTTLLAQQKQHVEKLLPPVRDSWKKKGASICSDGWSDHQQRPIINIMVASADGPMFLKPYDSSDATKDAEYVAKIFMEAVQEIGPANVVQIVTDNAANFKGADLNLLKVAEIRFASHIVMAARLKEVKETLEKTVVDPDWKKIRVNGRTPVELKAREIKDTILSDTWSGDRDASVLHLVYDMWDTMIEQVKAQIFEHEGEELATGNSTFFNAIQKVIEDRWNKSNTPLHCLAHSLFPKYYSEEWLSGGGEGIVRVSPNEDEEVAVNRDKCFQRIFGNPNDLRNVYKEYGACSCGLDYFGQPHVIAARSFEDPIAWWANYGSFTPLLQGLAFKLLSQPASSSCCERNWSTYGGIQIVKRNRLTSKRTKDLVYVHNNLCLLYKNEEDYTKGPSKYWDVGGGNFDDESVLESADLSLDDPQIEAMTFVLDS